MKITKSEAIKLVNQHRDIEVFLMKSGIKQQTLLKDIQRKIGSDGIVVILR